MAAKKTGRPPSYSEEQVIEGIEIVEINGDQPTGDNVKKAMCARLGVPSSINAQCLDREVQRLVEERERQYRERLVASLPEESRAAVKEIGQAVESAVLLHIGRELEGLREVAGRKVAAQEVDLSNQRAQIRDLLSKIDQLEAEKCRPRPSEGRSRGEKGRGNRRKPYPESADSGTW